MTKSRKSIAFILAFFMIVTTVVTTMSPCVLAATSGSTRAATINVTTKSNWWKSGSESITLTQKSQTYHVTVGTSTVCSGKMCGLECQKRSGYFGYYSIKIYNATDKKTTYKTWDGGKTCKINLGRNKKYQITVTYNANETKKNMNYHWQANNKILYKGGMKSLSRIATPSWYVSSTNKVSSYY